jgi:hypothetical protein
MTLLKRLALVGVAVALGVGASLLALSTMPQDKAETETLYLDENEEPQILGQPQSTERASLIRLLANPDRYTGKDVVTQGFFVWAFEHRAIYLSREDAFYHLSQNGLVLEGSLHSSEPNEDARTVMKKYHLQYVTVAGTFHGSGRGHLNVYYGGSLSNLVICGIHRKADEIPPLRTKDAVQPGP